MNTGLLFYLAHRTSLCQKKIRIYLSFYELEISSVKVCSKQSDLNPAMSQLIKKFPIVFAIGSTPNKQPDCAELLFKTLHIPVNEQGNPKGVLQLHGKNKTGYLIESLNQSIIVLPDIPEEIVHMLPQTCERLKQKFKLNSKIPVEPVIPYEKLIENAMNNK